MSRVIALAGNPNVGKSTVFNALTGLRQHTGNWPGKTVSSARGTFSFRGEDFELVDTPGCYSLLARSAEEVITRNFLCFGNAEAAIVVCDATCPERGLDLALQVMETGTPTVVAMNLMDQAKKRGIVPDLALISQRLGVPVIGTAARNKMGLDSLLEAVCSALERGDSSSGAAVVYPDYIAAAVDRLEPLVCASAPQLPSRWLAARLLDADDSLRASLEGALGTDLLADPAIGPALNTIQADLETDGISPLHLRDDVAAAFVKRAEAVCRGAVPKQKQANALDRRLDKILTGKLIGFPLMLLLLLGVFWLTIAGANVPSGLLADGFQWLGGRLNAGLNAMGVHEVLRSVLMDGVYQVLTWVIAVMLPPMAIFFPLFTLLEDLGYLPRVAFNLDRCFCCCHACGKQSLTMCMGFGCNAAGVTGCRIIDSPRERLIAILTNSLVPCNGRFPILITLITLFLAGSGPLARLRGAGLLAGAILLSVAMTLLASRLLSGTVLKGLPSSFVLELPPYRPPQIGRVIIRSVADRTLRVLGRAVVAAAPAGLLIWVLAHVTLGDTTLLAHLTSLLNPLGKLMGMDGVILTGFLLALPANEIILPCILMAYTAAGGLLELEGSALLTVLIGQGWDWTTAVSVILFTLFHWPCATTLLTIRKETGSLGWTVLAFILPTACGVILCGLFHLLTLVF